MKEIKTINVTFADSRKNYSIDIGHSIMARMKDFLRSHLTCEKLLIVSDETVAGYYLDAFVKSLKDLNVEIATFIIKPGEQSKSLESANKIYSVLASKSFSRSDAIVALGGGVVGDLTGYVAATYKRGIPFIQVPTTLLSQVDSSVGGKVAVNIAEGKNLIGAFYQPKYVMIDINFLDTLEKDQWLDGLGEIIKYAFIGSKPLFEVLTHNTLDSLKSNITDVIATCCDIKRAVVVKDEFDTGLRMTLNFGHTLGHAIEKHFGYGTFSHGQAVAMGMYLMMRQYEIYSGIDKVISLQIKSILEQYELFNDPMLKAYFDYCTDVFNDKKVMCKKINIIVVDKVGISRTYPLDFEQAKALLMIEE